MTVDDQELQQRMDAFVQTCRSAGAKITPQRLEIFKEIAKSQEHPHADLICQGVRKRLPTVSLDTVYRTLWWLTELGMVTALGAVHDRTRFDANLNRHHHFVCAMCGLTKDFYSEDLDRLQLPESLAEIGSIQRTQVEVKGICHSCAAKLESKGAEPPENTTRHEGDGE